MRLPGRPTPQSNNSAGPLHGLPASYLELLRTTNGVKGPLARQLYHLQLDSAEAVAEAAMSKRDEEFFPGFFVIGSNGGGEFIALDARKPGTLPVVAIDMTNANLDEPVLLSRRILSPSSI